MKPRFIYIHGNGTTHWSDGWAAWLKTELDKLGYETFFETMPDSIIARAEYWLPFLQDHVHAGRNDVLIGWSSGAIAALRYAETHTIAGSILVSPYYTDLGDDMEKQSGYFAQPWQWAKIKDNQDKIATVWGDDDPYIPQTEFEFIARQLYPTEIKIAGGKHFLDDTKLPQPLDYIQQTYPALQ